MNPDERPSTAPAPWQALVVELPRLFVDELAGMISGALGAEVHEVGSDRARMELYFSRAESRQAAADGLDAALKRLGVAPGAACWRWRDVPDGRWVERYQAGLAPFRLGQRFIVDPTGRAATGVPGLTLRLAPGRAFGTGEHPTTRLCAALIEEHVHAGERWLDLGCGSGILSLVLHGCGAADVLALDNDEEALAVTREALKRNGVQSGIRVGLGSRPPPDEPCFDGLVCNIGAAYLAEHATLLRDALNAPGCLIASGFLEADCSPVSEVFRGVGLEELALRRDGPWAAVCLRRNADR